MSYPNLQAELSRIGVSRTELAEVLEKNVSTVSAWLHGRHGDFPVKQAIKVQQKFFPTMSLQYLFSSTPISHDMTEAQS